MWDTNQGFLGEKDREKKRPSERQRKEERKISLRERDDKLNFFHVSNRRADQFMKTRDQIDHV